MRPSYPYPPRPRRADPRNDAVSIDWLAERTVPFFADNFPPWQTIAIGGPLGLLWSYACLHFAGQLKKRWGLKTGYTRKAFHFLIFGSAALIQTLWGTPSVCLFGGMCSLVILYAVVRGEGNVLYEAMAREKDAPRRAHYIVVPYLATLIGGLVSNILFGAVAVVGYLVTGLGDAVAEPVGTRFGRHTYRAPSLTAVKAVRSWEGSAAVFAVSALAIVVGISLSPELALRLSALGAIPLLAVVCAVLEAVSPHGWDNLGMLIVPSFLAKLLF